MKAPRDHIFKALPIADEKTEGLDNDYPTVYKQQMWTEMS